MIQEITFRPLSENDFNIVKLWLQKAHISNVWSVPDNDYDFYLKGKLAQKSVYPFIILADCVPIGFIQAYEIAFFEDAAALFGQDAIGSYGLDFFIGEEDLLNQGIGCRTVQRFCQFIFTNYDSPAIYADPQITNIKALKCFRSAGFQDVKSKESYHILRLRRPRDTST